VLEGLDTDFVLTSVCGTMRLHCLMTGLEVDFIGTALGHLPFDGASQALLARGNARNQFVILVRSLPPLRFA
jgi:hypothetical protein